MDLGSSLGTTVLLAVLAGAVLAALAGGLTAAVRARRRRAQERVELALARQELAALRARVEELARPAPSPAPQREYVITTAGTGRGERAAEAASVPARHRDAEPLGAGQFASVAVGESLVTLLSLGHGVRRALSAENRNRIAFEMRREVRRARKERRRELKQARRHLRSARRSQQPSPALREDAA